MLAVGCKAGIVWLWRYQLPGQYAPFGTISPDAFTLVWLPSKSAFHSDTRSDCCLVYFCICQIVRCFNHACIRLHMLDTVHAYLKAESCLKNTLQYMQQRFLCCLDYLFPVGLLACHLHLLCIGKGDLYGLHSQPALLWPFSQCRVHQAGLKHTSHMVI